MRCCACGNATCRSPAAVASFRNETRRYMRVPQSEHNSPQIAGAGRDRQIVGPSRCRGPGRPAAETVELAGPAALPLVLAARMQKARELPPKDQDRTPTVDRLEARFQPSADRVLVYPKQHRNLFHRVTAVDLHAPRIEPLHRHDRQLTDAIGSWMNALGRVGLRMSSPATQSIAEVYASTAFLSAVRGWAGLLGQVRASACSPMRTFIAVLGSLGRTAVMRSSI